MLDQNLKWKIYYTKVDKDGNEIESERGVYSKEYVHYGTADGKARELYPYHDGYRCFIAKRDPWREYTREVQCDICGVVHTVRENYGGFVAASHVYVRDVNLDEVNNIPYHVSHRDLCENCITKIREFISSMEVKKDDK